MFAMLLQSIAEKISKERQQSRAELEKPLPRRDSSSSLHSASSVEVAQISATVLEAEQRIAELAQASTEDVIEPASFVSIPLGWSS